MGFAQNAKTSDAQEVKKLKTIVALKEYPKKASDDEKMMVDSANAALRFAMENYWDFNEVVDFMPLEEAEDFVKDNEGYCYVAIVVGVSKSTKVRDSYQYVSYSEKLVLNDPKTVTSVYLPKYEGPLTRATAVYACQLLDKLFTLLHDGEMSSIMASRGYIKENGPNLIKKTLLIPKEYVNPKLSEDDIKLAYPYDLDICDLEKIEKAILEEDPKYAVVYYVPVPVGGKWVHQLYVSGTADGDPYGVADLGNVSLDLGFVSVGAGANKKYLINEKQMKQIGKIVD